MLKFFVDGDEKPNSLAVYRPSEIVASSTKPLVLLGVEEPTKIDMDDIVNNIKFHAYNAFGLDVDKEHQDVEFDNDVLEAVSEDNWRYVRNQWREKMSKASRSDAINETSDMLWCDTVDLTGHDDLLANLPSPVENYVDDDTGEIYDSLFEDLAIALVDKHFPEFEKEAYEKWEDMLKDYLMDFMD